VDKKFLTVDEVAQTLGLSRITIYQMTRKRRIPSVKIGSKRLIPAKWLDDLAEAAIQAAKAAKGGEGR